jgi:hypothetical protein
MSNLRLINETTASSVSSVDITDVFSADFDIYQITINNSDITIKDYSEVRFTNASGSVISASNYDIANLEMKTYTSFGELKATNQTSLPYMWYSSNETASQGSFNMWVFNPYSSSSYTFVLASNGTNFITGFGAMANKIIGVLKNTSSITGMQFFPNSGNFDNILVRTYGLRVDS